ncbi:MAG: MFS transporter, partial [Lysobacterales bacterium]
MLTRAMILVTVSTCTMIYALTATVVNVALPQLQGALSATPDQIAWVVTLNVIATAVMTPMTGWLVGRLGE